MEEKVKNKLKEMIESSINVISKSNQIPDIRFEIPKHNKFGDISTNVAFGLGKLIGKSPMESAKLIVSNIKLDKKLISKVEIAGGGFINFFLSLDYLYDLLIEVDENKNFANSNVGQGKKVNIEFVSANPVGPLNIVNARAAAVGNCIANLMSNAGFKVTKEFYINDVGNQTNVFGKSISLRYEELCGRKIEFPIKCYAGEYVKDIAQRIKDTEGDKYLKDTEEERTQLFKEKGLKWMIEEHKKDLERYGVTFDVWFSEKTLYDDNKVEKTIKFLSNKEVTYRADSALWFKSENFGDDKNRVLIKQDGSYTYLAADIAYHKDKLDRGFDILVDIWGPDHHGYITRMKAAILVLGKEPKETFHVLIAQQVNLIKDGMPFKMSKREGSFITMDDLISEVGNDAAKYFFLRRSLDSHLDFDINLAKKQSNENPVYYVQYAHARICSILEFAKQSKVISMTAKNCDLRLLKETEEIELMKKLNEFSGLLSFVALSYSPHLLPKYLEELAAIFHSFYTKHRVVIENKNLSSSRIILCNVTRIILKKGLDILGVKAPDKM